MSCCRTARMVSGNLTLACNIGRRSQAHSLHLLMVLHPFFLQGTRPSHLSVRAVSVIC